ncbi:Radical SAM superfamily protein [Bythopirellula polymerisocia]|uniref:Radical SAM superfamily protein n=2 Tax=Bythopirellula polymerisocia TaxID=2528003 RepID=A0A5C6D1Y6_9BACT|nr:Radical SAM superfamily protein [Bythopirellula polymerisocia]
MCACILYGMAHEPHQSPKIRGRGAGIQPANPYLSVSQETDWEHVAEDEDYLAELGRPRTVCLPDESQSIISENDSPDIPFRFSVNPYRGCAHGCSYCYARPTHEYLGFSAGVDFETKVMVKYRAAELLRNWLARPAWRPEPIMFSGVTDCYQPVEREFRLTRSCLEVVLEANQPVNLITKNALVLRDLDLLSELAARNLVRVAVSITSLDQGLTRVMEPRTSSPAARLAAVEKLSAAGISTFVMAAPIIPGLNDSELPTILKSASEAGARGASFVLLRLPTTVRPVFFEWLERELPDQAEKIKNRIRSTRNGRTNSAHFGERMRGTGEIADQIAQTFRVFAAKYGLAGRLPPLDCSQFRPPRTENGQMSLF